MRLYNLQSTAPERYDICTGHVGEKLQVLAGLYLKTIATFVVITFDTEGNLIQVITKPHVELAEKTTKEVLLAMFKEQDFSIEPISVKAFFLDDYEIGVKELVAEDEYFLHHKDEYSDAERVDYETRISDWIESGEFVFWWWKDFWCNQYGEIIAT